MINSLASAKITTKIVNFNKDFCRIVTSIAMPNKTSAMSKNVSFMSLHIFYFSQNAKYDKKYYKAQD